MDKNVLKKFAIESRQELMEKVANKINRYFVDEEFNVNQNGEVYVLVNDKHTLRLTKNEYENRQLLVKRIKEITLEQVIEEAAYTWFNRIIAIRYMEIHDYLPLTKENQSLGVRVLSSKDNTPDPEIMKISNLINPDLDIDFNKEYYGSIQDNNKRFEYVLLLVCKKLGKVIPQVFDGITDYIDILIPDNLLNESGYITKLLKDISVDNFEQVEIIGWLYQYYNVDIFNMVYDGNMSNRKVESNFLPAATQLFTPDWVVKYMVDNTLGKTLKRTVEKLQLPYYIDEENENNEDYKENIEKIKFLDPCCGSGHILVYAFELFFQAYKLKGYGVNNIVEKILKNNLFGLEIDDRAGQLSILAVLLKAREYDKNIFNKIININICSIQKGGYTQLEKISIMNENEKEKLKVLNDTFRYAKEIGSLIKVDKLQNYDDILEKINILENQNLNIIELSELNTVKNKIINLIRQFNILKQKYDVVVTNPPYLNGARMNDILYNYCEKEYEIAKADLSSVFTYKITNEFTKENGLFGIVTTISWLYLKSFESMRVDFIKNKQINTLVDFGTELFDGKIGHLPIVSWTGQNKKPEKQFVAVKLSEFCYSKRDEKEGQFFNKNNYFYNYQIKFEKIPGMPIAYWISDKVINSFDTELKIEDIAIPRQGMSTGDNSKYLRLWYEVDKNKIGRFYKTSEEAQNSKKKWFPYNKGGEFRKWYGNNDYLVNWENDGYEIKEYAKKKYKSITRTIKNIPYYFKPGITWSLINAVFGCRYFEEGHIFDVGGSGAFPSDENLYYILGLLNSNLANEFLKIINPTLNFQVGNIASIPVKISENQKIIIENIVKDNISISKLDYDSFETSIDFKKHPLIVSGLISDNLNNWQKICNERISQMKRNEEKINQCFLDIYELNNELDYKVDEKNITINLADKERDIKSLISYAVGCMFGRYSLDEEGIVYAGGEFDKNRYKLFDADIDNIIPLTEDNYFGDDIVSRFKKFIEIVYGKDTLYENLEFIAEILGKKNGENSEETIRRYFINDFYNDHVKMYQKRPIYWLFDSGKKNGFKCLIYMHRYNEGLVSKIRLDYLHRMQNTYEKELKEIADKLNNDIDLTGKRELSKRQADLSNKLQETNEYDEKIAHIADQRIKIDLDDGVIVNYAKFSVKNPKTGKDDSILANSKEIIKK